MPHGVPTHVHLAEPPKGLLASRTLWFNALALALLAAEAHLHLLQPALPVNVYALVAFALPLANAVLRLITTTALALPGRPGQPEEGPNPGRSDAGTHAGADQGPTKGGT